MSNDPVNHPEHYVGFIGLPECIEYTQHMDFLIGNAFKYVWRAGLKSRNPKEDLDKASWYITKALIVFRRRQSVEDKLVRFYRTKLSNVWKASFDVFNTMAHTLIAACSLNPFFPLWKAQVLYSLWRAAICLNQYDYEGARKHLNDALDELLRWNHR